MFSALIFRSDKAFQFDGGLPILCEKTLSYHLASAARSLSLVVFITMISAWIFEKNISEALGE